MELSKKLQEKISQQINMEFYSSYIYYMFAAYFKEQNLFGFAKWMDRKAKEELLHGNKFRDYIVDRRGKVYFYPIELPPVKPDSPLSAFEQVFAHEEKVTSLLKNLQKSAEDEDDTATSLFLDWFILEQVEEESVAFVISEKIRMAGSSTAALLQLDKEAGESVK